MRKILRKAFRKEKGQFFEIVLSLMMIVILIILFLFSFRTRMIRTTAHNAQTSLVSSLLAGAIIDTEIYGMSHNSVITDYDESKDAFISALETNLSIGSDGIPASAGSVIISGVTVHEYSVWSLYDRNKNGVYDGVEYWSYKNDTEPSMPTDSIKETTLYNDSATLEHKYYDLLTAQLGLSQTGNAAVTELLKNPALMSEDQWIAYRKFMGKYKDPLTGKLSTENWNLTPSSYTASKEWSKVSGSDNMVKDAIKGTLKTPNDVKVKYSTIYGDIGFWIGGVGWDDGYNIFNTASMNKDRYYIHVTKAVDIVSTEELDFTK